MKLTQKRQKVPKYEYREIENKMMTYSSGVRVGHGWATAQGAGYKGAPRRPPPHVRSLIKRNLYLLVDSLKTKKSLWWQH